MKRPGPPDSCQGELTFATIALTLVIVATIGCSRTHRVATPVPTSRLPTDFTVVRRAAVENVTYGRVTLAVPSSWPVGDEVDTGCDYSRTGAFIEHLLPSGDEPGCVAFQGVADAVRIGPLRGYPPTPPGKAPVLGGHRLTPVQLTGALGYRGPGFLAHSFWVVLPTVGVSLFFTYATDPAVSERILASVRVG